MTETTEFVIAAAFKQVATGPIINPMNRRFFIAGGLAAPALIQASPVWAEKQSLEALSEYLNTLKTAKGDFTQRNPDGSKSKGTFYIHRPGRMRFDYTAPDNSLVVVSGGAVLVVDRKSNTAAKQYPISNTPLGLLLAKNVDLSKKGMVFKHTTKANTTSIYAKDPGKPKIGTIKVTFTHDPIVLNNWIITDQSGKKTQMQLKSLTKGLKLKRSLFDLDAARKEAR